VSGVAEFSLVIKGTQVSGKSRQAINDDAKEDLGQQKRLYFLMRIAGFLSKNVMEELERTPSRERLNDKRRSSQVFVKAAHDFRQG
jgi:hypothetical protein